MAAVHLEIETKYDVEPSFEVSAVLDLLPELEGGGRLMAGEPVRHRLEATYFDTEEHLLAGSGLTMRRRTGGDDSGWHLKVPGPRSARYEVRKSLGRAVRTPPAALVRMLRARTGGAPLIPVARITTDRSVHRLTDAGGRVLLELADDRVRAERLTGSGGPSGRRSATTTTWRELEVELVEGDEALLVAADARLRSSGLSVAGSRSKLARVLGKDVAGPGRKADTTLSRKSSAGDVVLAHLAEQVEQVVAHDALVRVDAPDGVHKMRVASRRLRSELRTFRPVLGLEVTAALEPELRWLAAELGVARDAEVIRDRLAAALDETGASGADRAGAAGSVSRELDAAYRTAHAHVLTVLDSPRYHQLLEQLRELVRRVPEGPKASRPSGRYLPGRVDKAYVDVWAAVRAARHSSDPVHREEQLHEARKAAKRARYAAEAVAGVFGSSASRFAAAMEAVQEELGEHQDSVVMRERLRGLAEQAGSTGVAFAYGRLYAQEESRGERSQERFASVWEASSAKKLRRWLR